MGAKRPGSGGLDSKRDPSTTRPGGSPSPNRPARRSTPGIRSARAAVPRKRTARIPRRRGRAPNPAPALDAT